MEPWTTSEGPHVSLIAELLLQKSIQCLPHVHASVLAQVIPQQPTEVDTHSSGILI